MEISNREMVVYICNFGLEIRSWILSELGTFILAVTESHGHLSFINLLYLAFGPFPHYFNHQTYLTHDSSS